MRRLRFPLALAVILLTLYLPDASSGGFLVAGKVYVSLSGNDSTCKRADPRRPCRSLDRAFAVARLGDVVLVGGGDYPPQMITQKQGKMPGGDRPNVVMRPAPGEVVRLADLELGVLGSDVGPDHLTLEGFSDWEDPRSTGTGGTCEWTMGEGTTDVIWRDLRACNWYVIGVSSVRIVGGSWGPCTSSGASSDPCGNNKIDSTPHSRTRGVTIDGGSYHDYRVVPGTGAHFECLFVVGGSRLTIRRARFWNCTYMDIFVQYYQDLNFPHVGYAPVDGLLLENNFFSPPLTEDGGALRTTAVVFSNLDISRDYEFSNVLIRFNSFYRSAISFNDGQDDYSQFRYRNVRYYGNILERTWQPCPPFEQGYNLFVSTLYDRGCRATDRVARTYPYVDGEKRDLHLTGGPAATLVPTRVRGDLRVAADIDGLLRPAGRAISAGADQCELRPATASRSKKGARASQPPRGACVAP